MLIENPESYLQFFHNFFICIVIYFLTQRYFQPIFLCKIFEIIFIAVWYKCSHFNNFKAFFTSLKLDKNHLFKQPPCYQHMIHLINAHQLALHAFHFALMKDQQSSYLWIDSTTLAVCKNQRIQRHKSLAAIAARGKASMG